jgi:hypothetical protein
MTRWEYTTTILKADSRREEEFLHANYSWKDGLPKYAIESLIPTLNAYGADGWELIEMRPVNVGTNGDLLILDSGSGGRTWVYSYLCVFRRPLADTP